MCFTLRASTALSAVLLAALASSARAITVLPGQSALVPVTTLAQNPELAGPRAFADDITAATDAGTSPDIGWRTATNVIHETGSDKLDFTFRIFNTSDVNSMTWSFSLHQLGIGDAVILADSTGTPEPITLSVSSDGVSTFSSTTPLGPHQSTQTIVLRNEGLIDFRQTYEPISFDFGVSGLPAVLNNGSFLSFGPAPEPTTLALFFLSTGALALKRRRYSV